VSASPFSPPPPAPRNTLNRARGPAAAIGSGVRRARRRALRRDRGRPQCSSTPASRLRSSNPPTLVDNRHESVALVTNFHSRTSFAAIFTNSHVTQRLPSLNARHSRPDVSLATEPAPVRLRWPAKTTWRWELRRFPWLSPGSHVLLRAACEWCGASYASGTAAKTEQRTRQRSPGAAADRLVPEGDLALGAQRCASRSCRQRAAPRGDEHLDVHGRYPVAALLPPPGVWPKAAKQHTTEPSCLCIHHYEGNCRRRGPILLRPPDDLGSNGPIAPAPGRRARPTTGRRSSRSGRRKKRPGLRGFRPLPNTANVLRTYLPSSVASR